MACSFTVSVYVVRQDATLALCKFHLLTYRKPCEAVTYNSTINSIIVCRAAKVLHNFKLVLVLILNVSYVNNYTYAISFEQRDLYNSSRGW